MDRVRGLVNGADMQACQPTPRREIPEELDNLNHVVSDIKQGFADLVNRLIPVMNGFETTSGEQPETPETPTRTGLASEMRKTRRELEHVYLAIRELIDKVEV